jgi:hypothetical protein
MPVTGLILEGKALIFQKEFNEGELDFTGNVVFLHYRKE